MSFCPFRLVMLYAFFLSGFSAYAQQQILVKNESATLREKTSMESNALEKLKQFTPLTIVEPGAEWTKVKTAEGKTGYVLTRLLSKTGFVSTDTDEANIHRGPGTEYAIIMNYGKNFPLRVLGTASNGWLKVMDFEGDRGWISPKSVTASPAFVITRQPQVNVRQQPGTEAPKVFSAEKGVIFEALEEKDGWLNVKHPDGDSGWISAKIVYGWLDVTEPAEKKVASATDEKPKTETAKPAKSEKSSSKSTSSKSTTKSSGKTTSKSTGSGSKPKTTAKAS